MISVVFLKPLSYLLEVFAMGLLYDYHVMLTQRFVKGTNGYVKKAKRKFVQLTCLLGTTIMTGGT
jgi:membrane protein CcdC involved in cytochrome C biogenesis